MRTPVLLFILATLWGCTGKEPVKADKEKAQNIEEFSIMSFNVLYSTTVQSTLETIRATNADIVGLQEASEARIKKVADSLSYYYHSFDKTTANLSKDDTGILSRFQIKGLLDNGVIVELPQKQQVAVFSVHLSPYPYEPYDFRDGKLTLAKQAVASAKNTRIPEIQPVLQSIDSLIKTGTPVFLTGDFNEPSHLDWSQKAAENGRNFNQVVEWPCSKAVVDLKMKDAYRGYFPDEVDKPGITWTTNEPENEVYDRIDFIYHHLQDAFELVESLRVGRPDNDCQQHVSGYESDHYAVLSRYKIN